MAPLHSAAKNGNLDIVKALIRQVQILTPEKLKSVINEKDSKNKTPIYYALTKKHNEVVEYLSKHGAEIYTPNSNHQNYLHQAVTAGDSNEVNVLLESVKKKDAETLINFINTKDENGNTALLLALKLDKVDIVEKLLEYGAHCNTMDNNKKTALHRASEKGNQFVVELILTQYAVKHDQSELLAFINAKDTFNNAAIHYAIPNDDVVKLLLKKGAQITTLGEKNMTLLHCASRYNAIELPKFLLEYAKQNIDVNEYNEFIEAKDVNGNTALDLYMTPNGSKVIRWDIIKLFLEEGAIVNINKLFSALKHSHKDNHSYHEYKWGIVNLIEERFTEDELSSLAIQIKRSNPRKSPISCKRPKQN